MFGAYLLLWEPPNPSVWGHHGPHQASRFKKYSKFSAHVVRIPWDIKCPSDPGFVLSQPAQDFAGVLDTGYGPIKIADTVIHRSKLLNDPVVPIGCTASDADDNCAAWAQSRECEKNMLYMEQVCPCSCALRARGIPAPPLSAQGNALPPAAAPASLGSEPGAPAPAPMHQYNIRPAPKVDFSKNLVVALPP